MSSNKIRISRNEDYTEIDFRTNGKRIRRKIDGTPRQIELLVQTLTYVIEHDVGEETLINQLRNDSNLEDNIEYLERNIRSLYYAYINHSPEELIVECERMAVKHRDSKLPLSKYGMVMYMIGKMGAGKSSIIKKYSIFNGTDINVPFTDTSRTSTFAADYIFRKGDGPYKFIVSFLPSYKLQLYTAEALGRAVECYLTNHCVHPSESAQDAVIASFCTDPTKIFDPKFTFGRYYQAEKYQERLSKGKIKENDLKFQNNWIVINNLIASIGDSVVQLFDGNHDNADVYISAFNKSVKKRDINDPIFSLYQEALNQINDRIEEHKNAIISNLKNFSFIEKIDYAETNEYGNSAFSCDILNFNDEYFKNFIEIFTAKTGNMMGKSLFNLVAHLRMEMPVNENITMPEGVDSFVIQDSIGVAHNASGSSGSIENSTLISFENVDAFIIVDDSRSNGDGNCENILTHLISRVAVTKIFWAFTFFEELTKLDFIYDEEEELDECRIEYLLSIERALVDRVVSDKEQKNVLMSRLTPYSAGFMKQLKSNDNYDSSNNLLNIIATNVTKPLGKYGVCKINQSDAMLHYNTEKIPLIYEKSLNSFRELQNDIYIYNPPRSYKTTEALTRRLASGITYFYGARLLKPLDDFYQIILFNLAKYILAPSVVNFTAKTGNTEDNTDDIISLVIEEYKTIVSEKIREELYSRFFTPSSLNKWRNLYCLCGTGSDYQRRTGLIEHENFILPDTEAYLNNITPSHIIDSLIKIVNDSIATLESIIFS